MLVHSSVTIDQANALFYLQTKENKDHDEERQLQDLFRLLENKIMSVDDLFDMRAKVNELYEDMMSRRRDLLSPRLRI